jgi:phosphotransferase system enzyme I (PtsI)
MKRLQGKPISPGYGAGVAVVLDTSTQSVPRRAIRVGQVRTEVRRLERAVARSVRELEQMRQRVLHELGKSHSAIFEAHLAILKDPTFRDHIKARIEGELVGAEFALEVEILELCARLAQAGDAYLREREQDIRDVGRRILGHLIGSPISSPQNLPPRSVLVARELLPSDTLNIDRSHLEAIVTEEGGETGHAAILARALGVPAVTGVEQLTRKVRVGTEMLVDGETGEVIISPLQDQVSQFAGNAKRWQQQRDQTLVAEKLPCVTTDGVAVALYANIGRPEEVRQLEEHHLDGIGLLRTEFLFLDAVEAPSVEYQRVVYRNILDAAGNRPVVFRTLDMAADKHPRYLARRFDHQLLPFRGLRFSLKEGTLFWDQVQSLVTLAVDRDLRILLPMVIDPQDVDQAIEIIEDSSKKYGIAQRPPVGIMIETPAAVVLFERLVSKADFISIGTNDLTQYLLAADRGAIDTEEDYSVHHPAVLRAIRDVVAQSISANKPVSVCGEAAGDPHSACLLAGLGVRQFSMSPARAARVRQLLRAVNIEHCARLAHEALECARTSEVRSLLRSTIPDIKATDHVDSLSPNTGTQFSPIGVERTTSTG